jgi:hypothetical protein
MDQDLFDFVAGEIEERTDLGRLEARGTVRIALREAGLDARSVSVEQMSVVLERVLPGELRSRGVDRPDALCNAMAAAVLSQRPGRSAAAESPEDVFRRLGGR